MIQWKIHKFSIWCSIACAAIVWSHVYGMLCFFRLIRIFNIIDTMARICSIETELWNKNTYRYNHSMFVYAWHSLWRKIKYTTDPKNPSECPNMHAAFIAFVKKNYIFLSTYHHLNHYVQIQTLIFYYCSTFALCWYIVRTKGVKNDSLVWNKIVDHCFVFPCKLLPLLVRLLGAQSEESTINGAHILYCFVCFNGYKCFDWMLLTLVKTENNYLFFSPKKGDSYNELCWQKNSN